VRVLAASCVISRDGAADLIARTDPTIAAVIGISSADACSVASALSLRYAIQSWDADGSGKAVFWKSSVALHGLYRSEFSKRAGWGDGEKRGVLRVTLLWDGRPLDIFCAQLSVTRPEADWQLVDVAREMEAARGESLLAIQSAIAPMPQLRGYSDAAKAAPWRSVVCPAHCDISGAARFAFGFEPPSDEPARAGREAAQRGVPIRVYCSSGFAVVRMRDDTASAGPAFESALVVDLVEVLAAQHDPPHEPGRSDVRNPVETAGSGIRGLGSER
jgi:hypothetical protein